MRKRSSLDRALLDRVMEWRTGIAAHPQATGLQIKKHAGPPESDDPARVVVRSDQREPRAPSVRPTRLTSTRQWLPSRISRNCLKTNRVRPLYSTMKRGGGKNIHGSNVVRRSPFGARLFALASTAHNSIDIANRAV
jgi:hypothetical protein